MLVQCPSNLHLFVCDKEHIRHRMLSARINTTSAVLAFVILHLFLNCTTTQYVPLVDISYRFVFWLLDTLLFNSAAREHWLGSSVFFFFPCSVISCVFGIQVPFFIFYFFFSVTPHNLVYFYFYIKFIFYFLFFSLSLS